MLSFRYWSVLGIIEESYQTLAKTPYSSVRYL